MTDVNKPDLSALLNKSNEQDLLTDPPVDPDAPLTEEEAAELARLEALEATPAQMFQHYHSPRVALQVVTPTGGTIAFTRHRYITQDANIIAHLDREISLGATAFTKGELLSSEDSDPMAAYRKKVIEEYKEAEAEKARLKALGIKRDLGNTKSKEALDSGANPMSSEGVATANL